MAAVWSWDKKTSLFWSLFSLILGHQALICRVPCLFKYWPLILCYGEVKHLQTSLIVFMIVTEARLAVPYTFQTPLSLSSPPSLYHHPLSFKQIAHISVLSFLHISTCFYELFDIVCIFKLGFIVFSCF